jgi:hypothetical protein
MRAVFDSKTPQTALKSIKNLAAKDPTGRAMRGLRGAFYDEMMRRVAPDARADLDMEGQTFVYAKRLRKFVDDYRPLIGDVYHDRALTLMDEIVRGANMNAIVRRGAATGVGSDTAQNLQTIAGNIGVVLGSRVGGQMGTHELLAAGIGRRIAKHFINSDTERVMLIVEHALYDPKLAAELLKSTNNMNKNQIVGLLKYPVLKGMATDVLTTWDEKQ